MTVIADALVVGAGPAGLTAATALQLAGVNVTLVEITVDKVVLGSQLTISSPNLRELDKIGLAHSVVDRGVPIYSADFYVGGTKVKSVPTPNVAGGGLPPAVGTTRNAFHGALYEGAVAAGVRVLHDTTVVSVADRGDEVEVELSDGTVQRFQLVVGADGWNSRVRALCFPEAQAPGYSGQCVWRARVPRRGAGNLSTYVGHGVVAGLVTVDDSHTYVFCLVSQEKPDHVDPARFPELMTQLLAEFDGEVGWARDHIDPGTIHFAPMAAHIMPDPWYRGRVLLIGDAAHATTPHIGYGAGLAVEDGVILGECVASATTLEDALATFMKRRYERCRMVVENGLRVCRMQQGLLEADHAAVLDETWRALEVPA